MVLMAALALLPACSSKTFERVEGTVVDGRTGGPVARARLEIAVPEHAITGASTDAQGRFTLNGVDKRAGLRVSAANYRPASLQVAQGPLRVRLDPIPVVGTVRGRLTLAGLQAALSGKASGRSRPNGAFALYGVGPGDVLTVRAPGHRPASVTIDADRHVDVILTPEPATEGRWLSARLQANDLASVWRYAFTPPPGYRFQDARDLQAKADKTYLGQPGVKGVAVRLVVPNGSSARITAVVVAFHPRVAAQARFRDDALAQLTRVTGARPKAFAVAGVARLPYVAAPDGSLVALAVRGPIVWTLNAWTLSPLQAFAAAAFT
jgi:hypothetical protein